MSEQTSQKKGKNQAHFVYSTIPAGTKRHHGSGAFCLDFSFFIDLFYDLHWALQSRLVFRPGDGLSFRGGRKLTNEIDDKRETAGTSLALVKSQEVRDEKTLDGDVVGGTGGLWKR